MVEYWEEAEDATEQLGLRTLRPEATAVADGTELWFSRNSLAVFGVSQYGGGSDAPKPTRRQRNDWKRVSKKNEMKAGDYRMDRFTELVAGLGRMSVRQLLRHYRQWCGGRRWRRYGRWDGQRFGAGGRHLLAGVDQAVEVEFVRVAFARHFGHDVLVVVISGDINSINC